MAENIDTRLIVDFRFFGYVEPRECNKVVFQECYEDAFGMPQATFEFQMSENDRQRSRKMMEECVYQLYVMRTEPDYLLSSMCDMALKLGGYLPGSEPQFMTPGLALHLAGTVRAGSVLSSVVLLVRKYSKPYDVDWTRTKLSPTPVARSGTSTTSTLVVSDDLLGHRLLLTMSP